MVSSIVPCLGMIALWVGSTEVRGFGDAYVGSINIVGNRVTPDDEIRSRLPFMSGQRISYTRLREAEDQLHQTGRWKAVKVTWVASVVPSSYRDVTIHVEELDRPTFLGFSDPVASMSHLLIGAPLFLGLTVLLLLRGRGDVGRQVALALYGVTNVLLFAMSGVYHLLSPDSTGRLVLQRLDHAAIFCLIAGTFTPAHYILFRGWQRWVPLVLIWSAAIVGVVLKTAFFDDLSEAVGLTLYLGMGWFGGLSAFFIWYQYGAKLVLLLLAGALSYTIGALIDFVRWPLLVPGVLGGHECFHLAVLAGSAWFWYCVYLIAPGNYPKVQRHVSSPYP